MPAPLPLILSPGQSPPAGTPDSEMALLVMFLLFVVAPAMCTWLWMLWWRRFPNQSVGVKGEPMCGRCRYSVRGLPSFECPECGSDLREVGIIKSTGSPRGLRWTLAAWTFMWFVLAGMSVPVLEAVVYSHMERLIAPAVGWAIVCWFAGMVYLLKSSPEADVSVANIASSPQPRRQVQPTVPTEPALATRNLTIVFIDAVDFTSRISAASRQGVVDLVQRIRRLVMPTIEEHHGRVVKTMGDGVLAIFESPTAAVLAGLAIQQGAAQIRAEEPSAADLGLRIGITAGEVALENDDVYGDTVNLAARIQQLAKPGEVYLSEAVRHAMNRSEVPHEALGEFEIKGFEGAVKIYRALNGKQ